MFADLLLNLCEYVSLRGNGHSEGEARVTRTPNMVFGFLRTVSSTFCSMHGTKCVPCVKQSNSWPSLTLPSPHNDPYSHKLRCKSANIRYSSPRNQSLISGGLMVWEVIMLDGRIHHLVFERGIVNANSSGRQISRKLGYSPNGLVSRSPDLIPIERSWDDLRRAMTTYIPLLEPTNARRQS
ncbi:hypothetical protein TNCV_1891 [Trichonephila clavipes]|nr:hypothetical protein TNCV_1891 [Trichonephila clavipes]